MRICRDKALGKTPNTISGIVAHTVKTDLPIPPVICNGNSNRISMDVEAYINYFLHGRSFQNQYWLNKENLAALPRKIAHLV